MTRPPVCRGAGATFGLLMVEKERLRRIELEEGDGDAVSDERDRDRETLLLSESGVSIRDDALRRFTAPTRFRNATCVEIKLLRCVSATGIMASTPSTRRQHDSVAISTQNATVSVCAVASASLSGVTRRRRH